MPYRDNTTNAWLIELVNRCQVLSLVDNEEAIARTLHLLSTAPQFVSPAHEAVARRVVARTVHGISQRRGPARHVHVIETTVRLVLGTSLRADSVAALDACIRIDDVQRDPWEGSTELGPAAVRWASLVEPIIHLPHDVPTISRWSHLVAKSQGVIKTWCSGAGVSAGDSLDFARLLRVAVRHAGCRPDWHNMLDIIDHRTLRKLLNRSGVGLVARVPDADTFLKHQRFVSSPALLSAIETFVADAEASPAAVFTSLLTSLPE